MNISRIIQRHRADFRKKLDKESSPALSQGEYKVRIKVHAKTLEKYLKNFGEFLTVYCMSSARNMQEIKDFIGPDRLCAISAEGDYPTINEVSLFFKKLNLKEEFTHYLINKTHFSYSLGKEINPTFSSEQYPHRAYNKFAEFVYIILCEYIVLHNYMWASKLRLKNIKTIDKFMREFK